MWPPAPIIKKAYLTLQEFFEKLRDEPQRWGKPFSALLGALDAQLELGAAAIGGKDSMSGSFLDKDVPPTLISFAIAPVKAEEVLSPEFKSAGHSVYLFGSGDTETCKSSWEQFHALCQAGKVKAAWAVENSLAEAVMKMSFGNRIGFQAGMEDVSWYLSQVGGIVAELAEDVNLPHARRIGETTEVPMIALPGEAVSIDELLTLNDAVLEPVYPTKAGTAETVAPISWDKRSIAVCKHKAAHPKAVIPVFPGTNCEYDTARACIRAGIDPEIVVVRNLTTDFLTQSAQALERAIRSAQMVVIPGGFSGGDEPDGSAKFICSFLRNGRLTDAVHDLLKRRDGLMLGICNGFQALVKLGLVPYGEIRDMDETCPTLTYNLIGRHQSSYVTTRVASVNSPWMLKSQVGDLHTIPISHGEGRFVGPQGRPGVPDRQRPGRHPVCGRRRSAHHGHRLQPQRIHRRHRGHLLPRRPGDGQDGPSGAPRPVCGRQHPRQQAPASLRVRRRILQMISSNCRSPVHAGGAAVFHRPSGCWG